MSECELEVHKGPKCRFRTPRAGPDLDRPTQRRFEVAPTPVESSDRKDGKRSGVRSRRRLLGAGQAFPRPGGGVEVRREAWGEAGAVCGGVWR